jgi:ubiquinone/menaquinone biosynthesis C-methylase UbiE
MVATEQADWARRVSERYSADAKAYRDLWAPVLLPHGEKLLDALPLSLASRVLDVGAGCGALLPQIRSRTASALVVAIDSAPGMLALARSDFPRAAMDAAHLGIANAVVDVAVLAFVLFHTANPQDVLVEVRRVMRAGGTIGTATWDRDPDFPAQRVWIEELDAHGAGPAVRQLVSNHEPVSTGPRMQGLLERAGFRSVRTWVSRFGHGYTLDGFVESRTKLGWSKRRVETMAPVKRGAFLRAARQRLEALRASDFVDDTNVIFATSVTA